MIKDAPGASVFPAGRTLSPATVEALAPEMRKDVLTLAKRAEIIEKINYENLPDWMPT